MKPVPLILFQPPGGQVSPGAPHPVLPGTENSLAWLAALRPPCTCTQAEAFRAGRWASEDSASHKRKSELHQDSTYKTCG